MRDSTWVLLVLGLLVTGCEGADGPDVELLPDACGITVLPPDAATSDPIMLCGTESLGPLVADQAVTGTTSNRTSSRSPTCTYYASGMSADVAHKFVAPADGIYYFDTAGSMFNTVLTVLDNTTCEELACVHDPSSLSARAMLSLTAGQEVAVIVDGFNGAQGSYTLVAAPQPVCAPQVVNGTLPISTTVTLTGTSRWASGCGGSGPEATFQYTIPADGYYTFDTIGSSVDTQLYVRGDCYGPEYACDDNTAGSGAAQLTNYLSAGSTFEFVVDTNASGGTVRFNISGPPPPPPPPACPETALGSTSPQTVSGTTAAAASSLYGSCGGSGPEKTYSFTAPAGGTYRFSTSSAGDTVLFVRNGTCMGSELACNDDNGTSLDSTVNVALAQNQTVVIVVDSFAGGAPYTLSVAGPL